MPGVSEVRSAVRRVEGEPADEVAEADDGARWAWVLVEPSGEVLARAPLRFADETSLYRAALSTAGVATGEATLEVLVTDTERVNTGYARRTVELP